MTLATSSWQATVTGIPGHDDIVLDPATVAVEFDEAHAPYIEATIRAALPADVHLIDPRLDPRPRLELTGVNDVVGGAVTTLTADLLVHEAHINAKRAELTLICRSDEALLVDLAHVDLEPEHRLGVAVVPLVEWALGKVGAELATGQDRTEELLSEPVLPNERNDFSNGSGELNTTGWLSDASRVLTRVAYGSQEPPAPNLGNYFFRYTMGALTGESGVGITPFLACTPGETLSVSVWVRVDRAQTLRLRLTFAGVSNAFGSSVQLEPNTWTQLTATATVPAGASSYNILILVPPGGAWTAGTKLDLDGLIPVRGPAPQRPEYWDGNTTAPEYEYAWESTPDASAATRTWRPSSRAARIEPGQYLWDWLAPILTATGLRLYCDEARQWHLVPATQAIPGVVQVSGSANALDADDSIRLAGDYCDSVVIRYRWRDETGQQLEAVDIAGTGGRTKVITYETPYPGPGAATGILDRAQGRGHAQQLTALADLSARPGMTVISIIEGLVRQVGKIAAVRFTDDGLMHIRTRGLMDTPLTAWIFAEGEWVEQTETWATYTGPED